MQTLNQLLRDRGQGGRTFRVRLLLVSILGFCYSSGKKRLCTGTCHSNTRSPNTALDRHVSIGNRALLLHELARQPDRLSPAAHTFSYSPDDELQPRRRVMTDRLHRVILITVKANCELINGMPGYKYHVS